MTVSAVDAHPDDRQPIVAEIGFTTATTTRPCAPGEGASDISRGNAGIAGVA
ncbi:MAG: hypothetical protein KBF56_06385 [Gemmatimonadaceae bacterium]|nr:hypothetical protein [Gemmatimonadaceae bacterium]